ncbi:MAG: hypothetical protein LBS97_06300 [Treponema sp.]|jgi:hypothetical protein|nr:hypothetical protein [Treponema sp.]
MKRFLYILGAFLGMVIFTFFSVSCELSYMVIPDTSGTTPEFLLSGAKITRFKNKVLTAELAAEMIEQYKGNTGVYGSQVSFTVYEDDGTEIGKGRCGLFSADIDNEVYLLFDGIVFENSRDKFELNAQAMKWAAKQGLLASEQGTEVTIVKNRGSGDGDSQSRFSLSGSEFSANGHRHTFEFNAPVSGVFETGDYGDEN